MELLESEMYPRIKIPVRHDPEHTRRLEASGYETQPIDEEILSRSHKVADLFPVYATLQSAMQETGIGIACRRLGSGSGDILL